MTVSATILGLLNKVYRDDVYIQNLINAVSTKIDYLDTAIEDLKNNFFFDTLDADGCDYFERKLAITPVAGQSISDRRAIIQVKWRANTHNSIALIQSICDALVSGEVVADFVGGKIQLRFTTTYGVPDYLDILKKSIDEIKPCHLAYLLLFKYLLIGDIHEVKTIADMEDLTIGQFDFGIV